MEFFFREWYCCNNGIERNTLIALVPLYAINPVYVERDTFDAIAIATGLFAQPPRYEHFISLYYLTEGEFEIDESATIPVLFFDLGFWSGLAAYTDENGLTCASLCRYITYPLGWG